MSGPPDRTNAAPSHLADVWFQVSGLQVTSGRGTTVTTVDGDDYLDLTGGIAVTTTGHCHPRVVRAIQQQAERFIHAQANVYRHDLLEPLAARLAEVTPDGIDTFFLSNSGAEAVEAAVKLVRWATGRPNLIVFEGSFHGRTAQTMAMTTSKAVYRAGHQPLPAGVFVAPFPDHRHAATDPAGETARCLAGLEQLLATQTAPAETAGVVIEPVLGEGGYQPAPAEFLQGVRAICDRHDLLFVADEIQSGFGRTGAMFAIDHAGVAPDVLVMAKGMASGFPMSAVGARRELMDRWPQGSHGGTYGGNPLGCAAALATIDTIVEERLVERARTHGQHLRAGLDKLAARFPVIADVRGRGLMLACELVDDDGPATDRVAAVLRHCLHESRVIFMGAGRHGNVIRWMPPLTVDTEELDRGLSALETALEATR